MLFSRNTIELAIVTAEDPTAKPSHQRLAGLVLATYAREQLTATEQPAASTVAATPVTR